MHSMHGDGNTSATYETSLLKAKSTELILL